MALITRKVRGSTLIESILSFTIILLALGLSLMVITQVQKLQFTRNTNALFSVKKIHEENRIDNVKKTINNTYQWEQYTIEQNVKRGKNNTIKYRYVVKNNQGNTLLNYGFIEVN